MKADITWTRPPGYDAIEIRLTVTGIILVEMRDDPEGLADKILWAIREPLEQAVRNRQMTL